MESLLPVLVPVPVPVRALFPLAMFNPYQMPYRI